MTYVVAFSSTMDKNSQKAQREVLAWYAEPECRLSTDEEYQVILGAVARRKRGTAINVPNFLTIMWTL